MLQEEEVEVLRRDGRRVDLAVVLEVAQPPRALDALLAQPLEAVLRELDGEEAREHDDGAEDGDYEEEGQRHAEHLVVVLLLARHARLDLAQVGEHRVPAVHTRKVVWAGRAGEWRRRGGGLNQ